MAVTNKDFKIKHGLVVEGASALVNGNQVLTEDASDSYILGLTGGATLVKSVSNEFDVSAGGELSIDRATVDTYYDAAGDAAAAQTAAEATASADATSKANAAQAAAEDYADGLAVNYDAAGAAAAAQAAAATYTDGRETAITTAYQSYADTAESDAKAYADQKVADLVDSAPALLDTLNELAAAIGDDANFAANLATSVGEKVSKAGDTMTGLLVLSADPSANLGAATKQYVDQAETDAVATAAADATSKANAAEANAIAHADALDTDDIAEGTNLYFTDTRAKTSAAQLLTGATKTNIVITGDETGLTITAENGVADSTTTDLAEGTNLYFTDARAVSALEAVVPNFTAVEVNSVAKQVASTLSAATAGIQVGHAWAKADYRSAEFLVKVAYGDHTEISKVLLTLDVNDNIAITEYGIVGTNGSGMTVSAGISGANAQLLVTTSNNNSTVTVVGTLLA